MTETKIIFGVVESPEGGYEAEALGYPIFTQGDDWLDLQVMVRDAVECHFGEDARPKILLLRRFA